MDTAKKIFLLGNISFVTWLLGTCMSLLAVSLPDLQCLFHTSLKETSSLFLAQGASMVASCFLSVYLLKHVNLYLLMLLTMGLYTVSVALVAATPFIQVAISMQVLIGQTVGISFTNSIYLCSLLFAENSYAILLVSATLSFGSFSAPLIAKPFLGNAIQNRSTMEYNETNKVMSSDQQYYNESTDSHQHTQKHGLTHVTHFNQTGFSYCDMFESNITELHVLVGMLALLVTISFGVLFLKSNESEVFKKTNNDHEELKPKEPPSDGLFIALITLTMPFGYGIVFAYGSYLTTLGAFTSLGLGVQNMADLTSLYWLFFFFGRLAATGLSFYTSQGAILSVSSLGQTASLLFLILTFGNQQLLWIGTLTLAFFSGPIFGAVLVWSKTFVTLTPFVIGIWNMAEDIGVTLPFLSGQLIVMYGYKAHLFYCLGMNVVQVLMFCVLHFLSRQTRGNDGSCDVHSIRNTG